MNKNKVVSLDDESNVNEDKKTKKKSNAQKAIPGLIVAIVSLLVILTCVLIAYYQVYTSGKQSANILEGVYSSSYYSMVDNVNNLSVDVSKYSTMSTKQGKIDTMQDMMTDCNYIIAGLSVLPIDEQTVASTTKFFNQINGVCEAYTKVLNKNETLTVEQELLFDKIALVLAEIKQNFNKQNEGFYDSNFNFVDAGVFNESGMNELSNGMGNLTSESVEYPSMIFDGPFSTALETTVVKGLPEKEISKQEAEKYLKEVVYKNRNTELEYITETNGDIVTYDFNAELNDAKFFVQVSKRGGLLITMSGYAEGGDEVLKVEQAKEMAKTFANNIGFENMEVVWNEVDENVAYINLAPVVNSVIYYPDLVKVKVNLTAQDIIGVEATNYALNHINRTPSFNVTEKEAESILGFDYNILETNKVVIRLDSGKEVSCYEFVTERIDGDYFYYIDASTNQIVKTLKLVNVKDVEKLI